MEREKMVKSVMSGQPTTPTKSVSKPVLTLPSTPVQNSVGKLAHSDRLRCTPKMKIFQGSQTPVRTRPVSLFVHSDDVNKDKTGSQLGRSQSMRKPLESSPAIVRSSPVQSSPDNSPTYNIIPGRNII